MSEFLKEADKLLGNTVKSINDNLFADTENGANGQEGKDERESSTSQKKVEKPTPKKAKPSTTERLTPIVEDEKTSILEELKENYKENGREFVLNLLGTTEGILTLLCVVAFILIWIFAGFGWAIAVVILGLVIWAAIWFVKKMM